SNGEAEFRTPPVSARNIEEVVELMCHPHVLAGTSDGGAHTKFFQGGQWATDVLSWLGRQEGLVSLEEMHYRFAYQPARVMAIADRGAILEGCFADLIIYDFDEVGIDGFDYETRHDAAGGDWR